MKHSNVQPQSMSWSASKQMLYSSEFFYVGIPVDD
jgi:hypothetical protein